MEPARKRSRRGTGVSSLLELAAAVTAAEIPFERLEAQICPIPEPVQRRVLFHSFPRDEAAIRLYSTPSAAVASTSSPPPTSAFAKGTHLLNSHAVKDVLQIGFHLSGVVWARSSEEEFIAPGDKKKAFQVSLSFDRCRITGVSCSCGGGGVWWCAHAVAVALHRVRLPHSLELRLPISDTLSTLPRTQLQKLLQWLLSQHTAALPTAQGLADQLADPKTPIYDQQGAPDPTAGGDGREWAWHLDSEAVRDAVRAAFSTPGAVSGLGALFAKVRAMLAARDDNGPRLLRLLTEQLLAQPPAAPQHASLLSAAPDAALGLFDTLGALWVTVVLNPFCRLEAKAAWHALLKGWALHRACPPEATHLPAHSLLAEADPPRTVLHRALDACRIQWNDPHLRRILSRHPVGQTTATAHLFTADGWPVWNEYVPTACARVESLRAHGYQKEALALAVAVVRYIILVAAEEPATQSSSSSQRESSVWDGWLGHALDPVNALFDTLVAASESRSNRDSDERTLLHRRVKDRRLVQHSPSPSESQSSESEEGTEETLEESYLTLAAEAALLALAHSRRSPTCAFTRVKAGRQEESLLTKLAALPLDAVLLSTLRRRSRLILQSRLWGRLSEAADADVMGAQSLCLFLFQSLLVEEEELAYELGLAALAVPLRLDEDSDSGHILSSSPLGWPYPHPDNPHSRLANAMIVAAKDAKERLHQVISTIRRHTHSSTVVIRLAHDVQREADTLPDASVARQNLSETALDLGLQVLSMTVGQSGWPRRSMVTWLVNCVSHLSLQAVLLILRHWSLYFTPLEAVGTVGAAVMGAELVCQLKLSAADRDRVRTAVQELALQCVRQAPSSCALHALTLCESSHDAADKAYRLVHQAAAAAAIQPHDLFKIAHLMEARNRRSKALEMGYLAICNTHIPHSDDTSPLVQEIYWATSLAYNSGMDYQFERFVGQVVKNVKSAVVLSELIRRLLPWPAPPIPHHSSRTKKHMPRPQLPPHAKMLLEKRALKLILEAAMAAFVHTIHNRLTHISPRHYGEFLDFLSKAQETFLLSGDGEHHFRHLVENMKMVYKGKKKLLSLVSERFDALPAFGRPPSLRPPPPAATQF